MALRFTINNSVGQRSPAKEVRPSTYSSDKPCPRIAKANSLFVELILKFGRFLWLEITFAIYF